MESSIKFDTVRPVWSIVYIEGSHIVISIKYFISFSEGRPWVKLGTYEYGAWFTCIVTISSHGDMEMSQKQLPDIKIIFHF